VHISNGPLLIILTVTRVEKQLPFFSLYQRYRHIRNTDKQPTMAMLINNQTHQSKSDAPPPPPLPEQPSEHSTIYSVTLWARSGTTPWTKTPNKPYGDLISVWTIRTYSSSPHPVLHEFIIFQYGGLCVSSYPTNKTAWSAQNVSLQAQPSSTVNTPDL
jgi:hypothetical protein